MPNEIQTIAVGISLNTTQLRQKATEAKKQLDSLVPPGGGTRTIELILKPKIPNAAQLKQDYSAPLGDTITRQINARLSGKAGMLSPKFTISPKAATDLRNEIKKAIGSGPGIVIPISSAKINLSALHTSIQTQVDKMPAVSIKFTGKWDGEVGGTGTGGGRRGGGGGGGGTAGGGAGTTGSTRASRKRAEAAAAAAAADEEVVITQKTRAKRQSRAKGRAAVAQQTAAQALQAQIENLGEVRTTRPTRAQMVGGKWVQPTDKSGVEHLKRLIERGAQGLPYNVSKERTQGFSMRGVRPGATPKTLNPEERAAQESERQLQSVLDAARRKTDKAGDPSAYAAGLISEGLRIGDFDPVRGRALVRRGLLLRGGGRRPAIRMAARGLVGAMEARRASDPENALRFMQMGKTALSHVSPAWNRLLAKGKSANRTRLDKRVYADEKDTEGTRESTQQDVPFILQSLENSLMADAAAFGPHITTTPEGEKVKVEGRGNARVRTAAKTRRNRKGGKTGGTYASAGRPVSQPTMAAVLKANKRKKEAPEEPTAELITRRGGEEVALDIPEKFITTEELPGGGTRRTASIPAAPNRDELARGSAEKRRQHKREQQALETAAALKAGPVASTKKGFVPEGAAAANAAARAAAKARADAAASAKAREKQMLAEAKKAAAVVKKAYISGKMGGGAGPLPFLPSEVFSEEQRGILPKADLLGLLARASGGRLASVKALSVFKGGDIRNTGTYLRKVAAYEGPVAYVTPQKEVAAEYAIGGKGNESHDPGKFWDRRHYSDTGSKVHPYLTAEEFELRKQRARARGMVHEGSIPANRVADATTTREFIDDALWGSKRPFAEALDAGNYAAYTGRLGRGWFEKNEKFDLVKEAEPLPGVHVSPGFRPSAAEIIVRDPRYLINRLAGPKGILPRASGGRLSGGRTLGVAMAGGTKFRIRKDIVPNPGARTHQTIYGAYEVGKKSQFPAGGVTVYRDSYGEPQDIFPQVQPFHQGKGIGSMLYDYLGKGHGRRPAEVPRIETISDQNALWGMQLHPGAQFWKSRKRAQGWTDADIEHFMATGNRPFGLSPIKPSGERMGLENYGDTDYVKDNSDLMPSGLLKLLSGGPMGKASGGRLGGGLKKASPGRWTLVDTAGGPTWKKVLRPQPKIPGVPVRDALGRDEWVGYPRPSPRLRSPRLGGNYFDQAAGDVPLGLSRDALFDWQSFGWKRYGTAPKRHAEGGHLGNMVGATLVGEKGPEIITADGMVIPNHQIPRSLRRRAEGGRINVIGPKGKGFISPSAATGFIKGFGEIARVFVVNWPGAMLSGAEGEGGHVREPRASSRAQTVTPGSLADKKKPDTTGTDTLLGATKIKASPETAMGRRASMESVGAMRSRLTDVQTGVAEALQMAPARAITTAMTQVAMNTFGGRIQLIARAKEVQLSANKAQQALSAYQKSQRKVINAEQEIADEATSPERKAALEKQLEGDKGLRAAAKTDEETYNYRAMVAESQLHGAGTFLKQAKALGYDMKMAEAAAAEGAAAEIPGGPGGAKRPYGPGGAVTPGIMGRALGVGTASALGAGVLFSLGLQATGVLFESFGKVISNATDALSGFATTASRVSEALSKQVRPGAPETSLQAALGQLGLTPAVAGRFGAVTGQAERMAGAQNFGQIVDMLRANNYLRQASGRNPGVVPGIGTGFNNGPLAFLGPEVGWIGQTPGALEQLGGAIGGGPSPLNLFPGLGPLNAVVGQPLYERLSGKPGGGPAMFQGARQLATMGQQLAPAVPFIGSIVSDMFGLWGKKIDEQADQTGLLDDTLAVTNDLIKRGGQGGGGILIKTTDVNLLNATAKAFKDAGNELAGAQLVSQGVAAVGPGGAAATQSLVNQIGASFQRGTLLPSAAQMASDARARLPIQFAANIEQARFTREREIPTQLGMQLVTNRQLPPGAGVPGGGFFPEAKQAQQILQDIADKAQIEIKAHVPAETYAQIDQFATFVANKRTEVMKESAGLQLDQYNYQLKIAVRNAGDLLGLAGMRAQTTHGEFVDITRMGKLQREQLQIGRESQRLELAHSQRQINFNMALAELSVAGETPAERAARLRDARIENQYAQQQLDLSKRGFNVGVAIENITLDRQARDALKNLEFFKRNWEVQLDSSKLQDAEVFAQGLLGYLGQIANTYIDPLLANEKLTLTTQHSIALETLDWKGSVEGMVGAYDAANVAASNLLTTLQNPAFGTGGFAGGPSSSGSWVPTTGGTGSGGAGGGFAGGFLGTAAGPSWMQVGEAGTETVAVLRNPRMMQNPFAWNAPAGFGQTSAAPVMVNINFNGPVNVRDDSDIDKVVRRVEEMMNQRARSVGV